MHVTCSLGIIFSKHMRETTLKTTLGLITFFVPVLHLILFLMPILYNLVVTCLITSHCFSILLLTVLQLLVYLNTPLHLVFHLVFYGQMCQILTSSRIATTCAAILLNFLRIHYHVRILLAHNITGCWMHMLKNLCLL